ncbi:hypothetical protein TIFTF001_033103 [Ficus carica]|uniref:Uncharacterized protein n=1 Tax=Ficus carica TaxID=3494 RepID=A0AA88E1D3_FICCA|nr:hypothetical protein TIFTF001_033103 [Ficus carica]
MMADVLRALEFAVRLHESADIAAEQGIEIGEESMSDEKMTCWDIGGNQVVVRATYKNDVVHSYPIYLVIRRD